MQKQEKITYEIDPHNRLILSKSTTPLGVPRYRKVLDGKFEVDRNNVLTYHIKHPQDSNFPQQLKLSGNYSLDKAHNLVIALDKWHMQSEGEELTIKGELLDIKANELSFAVTTKDSFGEASVYILKLNGSWHADKYNCLKFNIERKNGLTDELILQGGWEVNKQNEIIYTYTKTHLKTKERIANTLLFKGRWDITGEHAISYILNKETNSRFDFKVGLGKPSKRGLEYEIGIGVVPIRKTFTLFGSWRINDKTGLLFEMPYERRRVWSIVFGAVCKLGRNNMLDFRLQNNLRKDIGINLRFSQKILKGQGEIFIQALKSQKEVSLIAGMGFMW